jgi:hypothetical protein
LSKSLMRPFLIEVRHIGFEDAGEVAPTQHKEMIQTLLSDTAEKPFARV